MSKIIVVENEDATPINNLTVADLTEKVIEMAMAAKEENRLTDARFADKRKKILKMNSRAAADLPQEFFFDFTDAMKSETMLKPYRRINARSMPEYFGAIMDLFVKPEFLKHLRRQLKSPRHIHGLRHGIVKHLWSVSLMCFFTSRNRAVAIDSARAGLYHDITLSNKASYFAADTEHPYSGGKVAAACGEPDEIVFAIEDHLSVNCITQGKLPRTKAGRKLLKMDMYMASAERTLSMWKNSKKKFL